MMGEDGRCKGFGFVNYVYVDGAQLAIETLDGASLPTGKTLTVRLKEDRIPGKGKGDSGKGDAGKGDEGKG